MKDKFGYTPEQNKEIDTYLTSPSKSSSPKKVELDMNKHIIDTLNKYEDGPDIVGGATPNDRPTYAERIASNKQLEKYATQPDSNGVYQAAVDLNKKAEDLKPKKDKNGYLVEATPKMVGEFAERLEKYRQMSGSDGRYDKAIIKKKKIKPVTPYPEVKFNNYTPYTAPIPDPKFLAQERYFKILLKQTEDKKRLKAVAGIAGLLGEFK